jgi:hypothetical protein
MNYKYIQTSLVEDIEPIRDIDSDMDQFILDNFMYGKFIGYDYYGQSIETTEIKPYRATVIDKLIYSTLEYNEGYTFI